MRTVLLTGFAGFIGSQILRDLLDQGFSVVGIDSMVKGSDEENYRSLAEHDHFTYHIMDINDPKLDEVLESKRVDYVINCAAESHVDRSWKEYSKFVDSNIKGPMRLANWALNHDVEKFVHVSTDEVFADSAQPFHEGSEFSPQNIYSSTKAAAEFVLRNYQKGMGLPLVITNGANTYGPRQYREKVIPKTVYRLRKLEKVPLYKTPAKRMWLHVKDHSSGIIAALRHGAVGSSYCLAPDFKDELLTSDLIKMICSDMNVDFKQHVDLVEDRLNYDLRYLMKNDKAKAELNWVPRRHIKEELANVIDWYKDKYRHEDNGDY